VAPVSLHRDERGLIGKILVLWLVVLAIVAVAAIDGGSILVAHVRTAELARDAASAGAQAFADSENRQDALTSALASVADADENARVRDFRVSRRGEVTLTVTDRAGTLLVGRIGFLEDLAEVSASASSGG
jgi:hypothetical protein